MFRYFVISQFPLSDGFVSYGTYYLSAKVKKSMVEISSFRRFRYIYISFIFIFLNIYKSRIWFLFRKYVTPSPARLVSHIRLDDATHSLTHVSTINRYLVDRTTSSLMGSLEVTPITRQGNSINLAKHISRPLNPTAKSFPMCSRKTHRHQLLASIRSGHLYVVKAF